MTPEVRTERRYVSTSRVGKGKPGIDVTAKGALGPAGLVAPTWEMVMAYKRGELSEEAYIKAYLLILEANRDDIVEWLRGLPEREVTFLCYCRAGAFCHRMLLAKWVEEVLGWINLGERRT